MEHIIVLTDFADYTYNALHYGIELACRSGAKLTILDSSKSAKTHTLSTSLSDFLAGKHLQEFPSIVNYIQTANALFKHQALNPIQLLYRAQEDFDVAEISRFEQNVDFDLLLISTKEKFGIKNFLFRNKVYELVGNAKYPILAIPAKAIYKPIRSISYATDLEDKGLKSIEIAYDLAQQCDANFQFVHILLEETRSHKDKTAQFLLLAEEILGNNDFQFVEFKNNTLLNGLKQFMLQNETDLLVLRKNNKTGLDKFLTVDVANKLAFVANIPVLVFSTEDFSINDSNDLLQHKNSL